MQGAQFAIYPKRNGDESVWWFIIQTETTEILKSFQLIYVMVEKGRSNGDHGLHRMEQIMTNIPTY